MKDLNFFSVYQGNIKNKKTIERYLYGATGILGLIIVITISINVVKIVMLNNSIEEYTLRLNEPGLQTQIREAEQVNGKIDILGKYDSALSGVASSVEKNNIITDSLLNDISGVIPKEVSFKDFDIKGYDVTIKGVTTTRIAVGEFEHNLSNLSEIKKVHVDVISKNNAVGEDYSFEMTCVLKEEN